MIRAKTAAIVLLSLVFFSSAVAIADEQHPRVKMTTSQGDIVLELDAVRAPKSVENFLAYVNSGFYNGTIFHRVISNFMIQGGGFAKDFSKKETKAPVNNEANNGLQNTRGTIAMARTADPHSATAQFFINTVDNGFLNHHSQTQRGWGYAVFGKVVEGMNIVDKIRKVKTGPGGPFSKDAPNETVEIISVTVEATGSTSTPTSPQTLKMN